ncbi:peptidase inhibitor family I36 protein [Streptomyces sp. NPDC056527]|uniref:peptidase inhibitor family I36 protein n=1 Tax=Streptomyces sp. NPDC056527 TaxID=3345853 RepID=UPI0036B1D958
MRTTRALVTALTVGALTLLTAPGADARTTEPATAAPVSVTAPAAVSPAAVPAPDGFLYAWEHPHAGGFHCRWNSNNANWAGCRNKVSDVWNNGFPGRGEDVRLFYGLNWTGSWVCLHQGHSLPDLGLSGLRFFSQGAGKGQLVNDNVSSHDWVDAC